MASSQANDFGRLLPQSFSPRKTSAARELARRLAQVESRNITHLYGQPPFWTDALGANVQDEDGNVFLDFTGAFGVAFAGHRHPKIMERIRQQAERLLHGMGDIHPPLVKVEFLEALAKLLSWKESRIILGLSGSDAVEAAIKTAHLATGRPGIIAFEGSYHGLTLGALAATTRQHFRHPFTDRLVDHVHFVPFPATEEEAEASLGQVERTLTDSLVPIGALIVEPIQGRAGVCIPPPGFLRRVAGLAKEADVIVIADEIFTGLGRTGSLMAWPVDEEDLRCVATSADSIPAPDLVCLGKALGGGMPLSACCGPTSLMDAWPDSTGEAIHTSTFLGHPLSCAGGLSFLAVLEDERLADRARVLGQKAARYLTTALENCPVVSQVRGRGLMLGIELHVPLAARVAAQVLERGLIVLPAGDLGQVVELTPPATISKEQLMAGLDTMANVISDFESQ